MRFFWRRLQSAPWWFRWPVKWILFGLVVFAVLYPNPGLFVRHVRHVRHLDALPDPDDPAVADVAARFDEFLSNPGPADPTPPALLEAVETFVRREIRYGWDWDVWGVVDYVPTVAEVIARGTEDCDGRAVLAAALLRARGVEARLVGDPRHMWVRTPMGETMNPLGEAAFTADEGGIHLDWGRLADLGPLAVGVSVFPLGREMIILLAAWLLLLPPAVNWTRSAIALFLLVEGLVVVRLAGADVLRPNHAAIYWGLGHWLAVIVLLRASRARKAQRSARPNW